MVFDSAGPELESEQDITHDPTLGQGENILASASFSILASG